jgi:hypothetical protein
MTTHLAHPPLHHRRLLPRFPAILARPDPRTGRPKRIHLHELVPHPRAIRPTTPQQARSHGLVLHRPHRSVSDCALHLRARQAPVND